MTAFLALWAVGATFALVFNYAIHATDRPEGLDENFND